MREPCGLLNENYPCMKEDVSSKRYPVTLIQENQRDEHGYLKYRRQSANCGGFNVSTTSINLDNKWVVGKKIGICFHG